jgi:altronate dehydratase small subunit
MTVRCYKTHRDDNVATLLDDAPQPTEAMILGGEPGERCPLREPIEKDHKVALADIEPGATVVKFGVPIGRATQRIERGQWVHLHNCRSQLDQRSATLDLHTGATTDTRYE